VIAGNASTQALYSSVLLPRTSLVTIGIPGTCRKK
jgi:hypothetical protein